MATAVDDRVDGGN